MGKVIKLEDRRRPKEWMELTPKQERENKRWQEQTLATLIGSLLLLGSFLIYVAAILRSPSLSLEANAGLNAISDIGWFSIGLVFLVSVYALLSTRRPGPPC